MSLPHMTPRQRAREVAFQFLYRLDHTAGNESQSAPQSLPKMSISAAEREFKLHADHFEIPKECFDFAQRLAVQVFVAADEIDKMIMKHAENWRLERFGTVERSFLRLGTAELLYFKDVPASVTLNEIIELSKYFGEAETPAFLNGILDPISREPAAVEGKIQSE